jgi:hypothetical protein
MASLTYKTLIVLAFLPAFTLATVENQAHRLNNELNILRAAAEELDVYVPENQDKKRVVWFAPDEDQNKLSKGELNEDSVSLGMSAIQKKNHSASDKQMQELIKEVEATPTQFPVLKKRRFRSR